MPRGFLSQTSKAWKNHSLEATGELLVHDQISKSLTMSQISLHVAVSRSTHSGPTDSPTRFNFKTIDFSIRTKRNHGKSLQHSRLFSLLPERQYFVCIPYPYLYLFLLCYSAHICVSPDSLKPFPLSSGNRTAQLNSRETRTSPCATWKKHQIHLWPHRSQNHSLRTTQFIQLNCSKEMSSKIRDTQSGRSDSGRRELLPLRYR